MEDVEIDKAMCEKLRKVFDEKIAKYIVHHLFQKKGELKLDETAVILQIFENGFADIEKHFKQGG